MTSPNEIKTVEDAVREFESVFPDSTGRHLYPTTMVECKDYIRTSITALLKHVQSEIEKGKRDLIIPAPLTSQQDTNFKLLGCNAAKDEDIGILEAMIRGIQRKSKMPISRLKSKLWVLCREITRKRYGNTCYTCGRNGLVGGNYQTGHYITSSVCSAEMRYSLDNLRIQCYNCNINLSGNWIPFGQRLEEELGKEAVANLFKRNNETKGLKYDQLFYERKIAEYTEILESLC